MQRADYFIKRLLLIIPTFIGITFLVFLLCQFVPGGPVEQARAAAMSAGGEGGGGQEAKGALSEEDEKKLEAAFGFDKPIPQRYWHMMVTQRMALTAKSFRWPDQTTWEVIRSRFQISLIFGITSLVLTYIICIPLGISKALRDGGTFDITSSIIIFTGYAIPAFAFGMILKMLFCGTVDGLFDWFPVAGFTSDHYEYMSPWGKFKDIVWHMCLPVICYVIGNFAVLTLLMKNSLLEQISQDYVRTVLAKGGSMRAAIWVHALRNALIPIATGIGGILTVMFVGSVLIERVFEIPGMGRLSLEAIMTRDYALFIALLSLQSILGLLGNVLQDVAYVIIDPRINFESR